MGDTSLPYIAAGHGDAWAAEAASRGQVGTQRLLRAEVVQPDDEVRRRLALGPDEQAVSEVD